MSESRRRLATGLLALVLAVIVELRAPAVTEVAGLLLCTTMGVAVWLRLRAFGVVDTIPRLAGAVLAVPAAIMAAGLLLSATRIGIRPESVAPCLLVITLAVLAIGPPDERLPGGNPRFRWSAVSPAAIALGTAAVVVLGVAMVASVRSYQRWEQHFTFSTLAATADADGLLVLEVGNHDGADRPYRVTVSPQGSDRTVLARNVTVPNGQSRTLDTGLPIAGPMSVQLYLAGGDGPIRTLLVDRGVVSGGTR